MAFEPAPIALRELVAAVEGGRLVQGDPLTLVRGVSNDTRRLRPGEVFVAIPGYERDALTFVPQALDAGASAIAAEAVPPHLAPDVPLLLAPPARRALADLSAAFYR